MIVNLAALQRGLAPASVLLILCQATAQDKPADWRPVKLTPAQFGAGVDRALASATGLFGQSIYEVDYPPISSRKKGAARNHGAGRSDMLIQSPKQFRVEFVNFNRTSSNPIWTTTVVRNGAQSAVFDEQYKKGWKRVRLSKWPMAQAPASGYLANWPERLQYYLLHSLFTGAHSVEALMKGLATSGRYSIRVEENTQTIDIPKYGPQKITNVRVYATSTPAAAKKYGQVTIEFKADKTRSFPTLIHVTLGKHNQGPLEVLWKAQWSPRKFPSSTFRLPS